MTAVFKLRPQIKKIVELAIKNQATGMIFIPDRLVTAGQVDDAKPAYAKENFASYPGAAFIRASMKKRFSRKPRKLYTWRMNQLVESIRI